MTSSSSKKLICSPYQNYFEKIILKVIWGTFRNVLSPVWDDDITISSNEQELKLRMLYGEILTRGVFTYSESCSAVCRPHKSNHCYGTPYKEVALM